MKTPLEGPLSTAELKEYLAFLRTYSQKARDASRAFSEMSEDAANENRRLERWIETGARPKSAYLLSMIDETAYKTGSVDDTRILEDLAEQRRSDGTSRRRQRKPAGDSSSVRSGSRAR
eukprot:TRINITY_DN11777_c0_g1_i2.p1 TRINITY_DN11777_c0_g1~~TRINITY_DN11777_c0_g1_i2.p1  ORF type:complete len:119 (+),score=27.42 TRINITY_DN11777_c0_g1_i2:48-404(+)